MAFPWREGRVVLPAVTAAAGAKDESAQGHGRMYFSADRRLCRDMVVLATAVHFGDVCENAHAPCYGFVDLFAATGVLGLRVLRSLAAVRQARAHARLPCGAIDVVLNDIDERACTYARTVVEANAGFPGSTDETVRHTMMGASQLLGQFSTVGLGRVPTARPSQIHLDPFGSCEPYLRDALSAIDHGGILSLSFTVCRLGCHRGSLVGSTEGRV